MFWTEVPAGVCEKYTGSRDYKQVKFYLFLKLQICDNTQDS